MDEKLPLRIQKMEKKITKKMKEKNSITTKNETKKLKRKAAHID
jgi:hypothetical protein